jgi:hypothetical protein
MLEVKLLGSTEDPAKQAKHVGVRIRSAAEEDDPGAGSFRRGDQARIVQVRGDNHAPLIACDFEDSSVGRRRESSRGRVDGVVT